MTIVLRGLDELPKELILYHCNTSYASQKARLYMAQMAIPYESEHIDLRKQEHILSNYRDINPLGQVPSLVDNAQGKQKIICGSTKIMLYLDENFCSATNKMPDVIKSQVTQFCLAHEALHDPYLRTLSYYYLFMQKQLLPEEAERLVAVAQQHPNSARGEFLKRAVLHQFTDQEIEKSKQEVTKALEQMESLLATCTQLEPCFMFGKQYTMADAAATASIFRVLKMMPDALADYPHIQMYYEYVQSLPSFAMANLK